MIGLIRRVMSMRPTYEAVTLLPEPSPEPEPEVQLSLEEEIFLKARMTCANYCIRNDLSASDLKDLLEMLGLVDGEVFSLDGKNLTYCHP